LLLAKDSVVRKTYNMRRKLRKTKTAGNAMGNHPGKYVIFYISSLGMTWYDEVLQRVNETKGLHALAQYSTWGLTNVLY